MALLLTIYCATALQMPDREEFKSLVNSNIIEIYVHNNRKKTKDLPKVEGYEPPTENFFDLDTTSDNSTQSFTKLIHHLKEINKL